MENFKLFKIEDSLKNSFLVIVLKTYRYRYEIRHIKGLRAHLLKF